MERVVKTVAKTPNPLEAFLATTVWVNKVLKKMFTARLIVYTPLRIYSYVQHLVNDVVQHVVCPIETLVVPVPDPNAHIDYVIEGEEVCAEILRYRLQEILGEVDEPLHVITVPSLLEALNG